MGKTGYFYRALLDKSLATKGEECKGGKHAKYCITLVLICLAVGEKLTPLVIGKSVKPPCFRNINLNQIKCAYLNSKKAWMVNALFNQWLLDLNPKMKCEYQKVLMF